MADLAEGVSPSKPARRDAASIAATVLAGVVAATLAGGALSRQFTTPPADAVFMQNLSEWQVDALMRGGRSVAIIPAGAAHDDVARIARMLGNALVAPEAQDLERAARELKGRGFRSVAIVGSSANAGAVGEKLNREWARQRVRVATVGDCCMDKNSQAPQSKIDAAVTYIRRVIGRIDT